MGAVNQFWHRWVYASIAKHLKQSAGDTPIVVEFLDVRGPEWKTAQTKAEVTITGLMTKELCGGLHRVWVDVFVTLTSHLSEDNNFRHLDAAGAIASALDTCIVCKDYGWTNERVIGVVSPFREGNEQLKVNHLKPAAKDTQLHSTIQSKFLGYFSE